MAYKPANLFEQRLIEGADWIRSHQERAWTILGLVAITVAMIAFGLRHRQLQNDDAWNQLGPVQQQAMQSPGPAAKKAVDDWMKRFGNTEAASYAKFIEADLDYHTSDYASAAQVYGDLSVTGAPLVVRPLALSGQVYAEEMAGRYPQALSAAQNFIQKYPDHFLGASMYLAQARLQELAGNPSAAAASYDRLNILYPQSPWTAFAKARLQALSGASGAIPAPGTLPVPATPLGK